MTGPARAERSARWPRALESAPRFVARDLVLARLEAEASGQLTAGRKREALLVATLLNLSLAGAQPAHAARPWELAVPLDVAPLAALGGLSPGACAEAIELLVAAGVVLREPSAEPEAARLAAEVFGSDPSPAAVDWSAVLGVLAGDAVGLLVVRALADLLRRPDRLACVTREQISDYTLYSGGMVKRGIASAVKHSVIDRAPPNAYRFSDWALGRASRAAAPPPPAPSTPAPAAAGPTPARQPSASGLVSFTAAGIPLELPRDTTIELEANVGGQPTKLRIRFPSE